MIHREGCRSKRHEAGIRGIREIVVVAAIERFAGHIPKGRGRIRREEVLIADAPPRKVRFLVMKPVLGYVLLSIFAKQASLLETWPSYSVSTVEKVFNSHGLSRGMTDDEVRCGL